MSRIVQVTHQFNNNNNTKIDTKKKLNNKRRKAVKSTVINSRWTQIFGQFDGGICCNLARQIYEYLMVIMVMGQRASSKIHFTRLHANPEPTDMKICILYINFVFCFQGSNFIFYFRKLQIWVCINGETNFYVHNPQKLKIKINLLCNICVVY